MTFDEFFLEESELKQRIKKLRIDVQDVEEKFIRSSGSGGQKVNKTSSCVQLKYLPADLVVKCQTQRSQAFNRKKAWDRLLDKIEQQREEKKLLKRQERYKKKARQRKRSKAAKERMLEGKKRQSQKKVKRRKVSGKDLQNEL